MIPANLMPARNPPHPALDTLPMHRFIGAALQLPPSRQTNWPDSAQTERLFPEFSEPESSLEPESFCDLAGRLSGDGDSTFGSRRVFGFLADGYRLPESCYRYLTATIRQDRRLRQNDRNSP
jgi:hypothetical protein